MEDVASGGAVNHNGEAVARSVYLVEFWAMFGVVQFLSQYRLPYTSELRALFCVCCLLPWPRGAAVTRYLFTHAADPVFKATAPLVAGRLQQCVRWCAAYVSLAVRVTMSAFVTRGAKYLSPKELAAVKTTLEQCSDVLEDSAGRVPPTPGTPG